MKKVILIICVFGFALSAQAQKEMRTYIFGHSLLNHEFEVMPPVPSQETSVPHWFYYLSEEAGHDYQVSGQYGFLPQHANLPPRSNWFFESVPDPWDSDVEPFSDADYTNILITPGNFIQWQGPRVNYYGENYSPISTTTEIFEWCIAQEDSLVFYIYENWPDMGPYLSNGFPPNPDEWERYNDYLNGDFHDWFLEYHDILQDAFPNSCIRMIPTGPIISAILSTSPFDQIPMTELYQDDAPHGRATTYFLASLVSYMAMFEEEGPIDFQVDPIIHPIVANNYQQIVDIIWPLLLDFNDEFGNNRVFCQETVSNNELSEKEMEKISVRPNPFNATIELESSLPIESIKIYDAYGRLVQSYQDLENSSVLDVRHFSKGMYTLIARSKEGELLIREKMVKHSEF